jgi:hypothetical protein
MRECVSHFLRFLFTFFISFSVFATYYIRYALDRVLLAEHKAIESHKAQEALALEKARLAAEWAPLAQELTALKKVVELRDYQVWVDFGVGLGFWSLIAWRYPNLFGLVPILQSIIETIFCLFKATPTAYCKF